jgi:hypothetical protein
MPRRTVAFMACWMTLGIVACVASAPRLDAASTHPAAAKEGSGVKAKNLKVLPSDISQADLIQLMARYSRELGVQCEFCHAESPQGIDFVSDQSPAKQTARVMIGMLSDINTKYLAQVSDWRYSVPLTCGNCHQGQTTPPVYEVKP